MLSNDDLQIFTIVVAAILCLGAIVALIMFLCSIDIDDLTLDIRRGYDFWCTIANIAVILILFVLVLKINSTPDGCEMLHAFFCAFDYDTKCAMSDAGLLNFCLS